MDLVAEAVRRLRDASLLPPVKSVEHVRRGNSVRTMISVSVPVGAELQNRIAEAMGSLHYALREFPSGAGEDGTEYRA
jgi:F0F1-type ATP synthase beta subunit